MRLTAIILALLAVTAGSAVAQTVRCDLLPRPYGLGGVCVPDSAAAAISRLFADSARIWFTGGPRDQPPWRGNLSLPRLDTSFELAREELGPGSNRLVLRTGVFWLSVLEWREGNTMPEGCSACDRSVRGATLILDLATKPAATENDVAILRNALARLEKGGEWNRREEQRCSAINEEVFGLFCLLYSAVESQMGRYHHRQPALELVRGVISQRWRDRITSHQLVDFNNHSATTIADLRMALELALARAQSEAQAARK